MLPAAGRSAAGTCSVVACRQLSTPPALRVAVPGTSIAASHMPFTSSAMNACPVPRPSMVCEYSPPATQLPGGARPWRGGTRPFAGLVVPLLVTYVVTKRCLQRTSSTAAMTAFARRKSMMSWSPRGSSGSRS